MNNTHIKAFYSMTNPIQDYAWGSSTSINQLFDIENPTGGPQAEIWMGAHPNGCSTITDSVNQQLLSNLIESNKNSILGNATLDKFNDLPYLFKVLAAEKALSIQVHPSKEQAENGFELENKNNVSLNEAVRNYKDPNHKPELVYALTSYQAMNGFRTFNEILDLLEQLNSKAIADLVESFKNNCDSNGLKVLFEHLLNLKDRQKEQALSELLEFANQHSDNSIFSLIIKLEKQYANDIGLFSPLLLNVITLSPGQAMFLDACTPHAYINGTAMEIMASSDNVLRAGLTPKHIDVSELVSCTRFEPILRENILTAPDVNGCEQKFPVPVDDFKFSVYTPTNNELVSVDSAEILFALDSEVVLTHADGEEIQFKKGQSVFIPFATQQYRMTCKGRVARAFN